MNPQIDPVTGQPVQAVQPTVINRAGAPPRQMNNLQVNALDPNTSNFNNTQSGYANNMFSTPMMKTEGEVSMATDATKLKKGGDKYGEFKSMKMKRPDGVTVSADMSTATKDKLPELTVTAKLGDLNKDGKMSSWEQSRQDAIDSNSPATKNDPPKKPVSAVEDIYETVTRGAADAVMYPMRKAAGVSTFNMSKSWQKEKEERTPEKKSGFNPNQAG